MLSSQPGGKRHNQYNYFNRLLHEKKVICSVFLYKLYIFYPITSVIKWLFNTEILDRYRIAYWNDTV